MLPRIRDKIVLAAKGKDCLNPTLSESQLAAFENEYRIALPEEYRTFLLQVGDGGLGPGDGLTTLAESVRHSPTVDLDKPFPLSFRMYKDDRARFCADLDVYSVEEANARQLKRHEGLLPHKRPGMEYAQPGVLYLATPDPPWASVYLVITGEDRGKMWMYGFECGWDPEAPTWEEDEKQINKPPRSFFRWYEDWLDQVLSAESDKPR